MVQPFFMRYGSLVQRPAGRNLQQTHQRLLISIWIHQEQGTQEALLSTEATSNRGGKWTRYHLKPGCSQSIRQDGPPNHQQTIASDRSSTNACQRNNAHLQHQKNGI